MNISDVFMYLALLIELVVTILAAMIAVQKQKLYGWFIALTFGLFFIFDLVRIYGLPLSADLTQLIFLVACGSMLYAVWLLFKE
jgi:hypothetical protein